MTVEQAAREARYGVFGKLLADGECDLVALAHHADDQTETVLMRIFRGTGIRGLRGMSERSGRYFRPLLSVPRSEIDAYAAEKELPYTDDETNSDESYTRNFVRAELKKIKQRFPAVNEAVARLARNAAEADDFMEESAPYPVVSDGEVKVPLSAFGTPALAKKTLARACAALGVEQDVEEKHYAAVLALAHSANGSRTELSHSLTAHIDGGYVVLTRGRERKDEREIPFPRTGTARLMGAVIESVPPATWSPAAARCTRTRTRSPTARCSASAGKGTASRSSGEGRRASATFSRTEKSLCARGTASRSAPPAAIYSLP